ncbi:DUF559 domain-containing protein [Novosphingobium sp. RD2P27]|uniref:DUF559 domain-containing protein n=1 Tax=Novosphingobium kalidii TaxID=3230299 RepID=A0ABV2CWX3_9SPHN
MNAERKTLGISREATPKADVKVGFAATGARLEKLKERARSQRRSPSPAQEALWKQLSGSRLGGVKFTRQTIVGSVIVDFACPARWVVVMISPEDANAEVDALQDKKLSDVGVRVLRFAESEVLADLEPVVKTIAAEVNKPFDKRAAARRNAAPRFEGAEG